MTEANIHEAIVSYLRAVLPGSAILHHSPNEGNRGGEAGKRDGARRKRLGVHPGFPDLVIIIDRQHYYIEVKAPGGILSSSQRAFRDRVEYFRVARSIDEAREILADWGIRTREVARG